MILNTVANKDKRNKQWKFFIAAISKSPAIKGLLGALIIQSTPWTEQLKEILWAPSQSVILLALVVLGMRLSCMSQKDWPSIKSQLSNIKTSLILKLFGLPTLMLCLCLIFKLPTEMRDPLVLQAGAPTAISVLLISQACSKDEDKATYLVALSTLGALITIPLWSLVLKI